MDIAAPVLKARRSVGRRAAVLSVITALSMAALAWAVVITRPAPEPPVNITDPAILYTTPFARFVTNGAAIIAVGVVLFLLLLGAAGREKYDAVAARARVIAVAAGIAWVTATTTTWWLQAAAISGSGSNMPFAGMASYAVEVTSGTALALTVVAATAYTVLVLRRAASCWPMACALVGLVAVPATGHASQTSAAWLTTPAICLHVCAVSLWVGGLALTTVLVAGNRSALSLVLPRFSTVAGGAIATVAVTGVLLAGPRLTKDITPHPSVLLHALFETPAGWLIIGKLIGLAILAATGGFIRQFLLPAVRRQETVALATLATVELTVMAVTIAIATVLARPL